MSWLLPPAKGSGWCPCCVLFPNGEHRARCPLYGRILLEAAQAQAVPMYGVWRGAEKCVVCTVSDLEVVPAEKIWSDYLWYKGRNPHLEILGRGDLLKRVARREGYVCMYCYLRMFHGREVAEAACHC